MPNTQTTKDVPSGKNLRVRTSTLEHGGEYLIISPEEIFVGNLNPRKTFNEEKLKELVESVREKGVLEPLLVRPMQKPKGKCRFELVAGERRLRAALRAELRDVPVIARAYTDQEALEIAVIENEQRDDLPVLEKAEGYQRLMKECNYSAEALAARINKSEAHVHSTIKLLNIPDFAKKYLNNSTINKSHAEIIARVPNEEGRVDLAKKILFGYDGKTLDVSSVRQAKAFADQFTKELSKAPFDTKLTDLIAGIPACTVCPFRSGFNRKDYPDSRADICNNVSCFNKKTEAGRALQLAALTESKGAIPLSKEEVKKYLQYGYLSGNTPYVELKDSCHQDKKYRSYRQLVGRELGKSVRLFVAVKERDSSIFELSLRSEVNEVLKRVHNIDLNGRAGAGKENAQRRLKAQARGLVVTKALGIVAAHFQKQVAGGFAIKFDKHLRMATISMLNTVQNDALREVSKRRGLVINGKYPQFAKELAKAASKLNGSELFALMMEAGVSESLFYWKGPYGGEIREHSKEVLKAAGVDLTSLEAAELRVIKENRNERERKSKVNKTKKGKKAGGKGARGAKG